MRRFWQWAWRNRKDLGVGFSVVVAVSGGVFSYRTLQQTRQLTENKHDIELVARFADFHFASDEGRDSRRRYRFTLHIVDQIRDPGFQRGLRMFVFSEMMLRNVRGSEPTIPFDKENDDWIVAGEALGNLRRFWNDEGEGQTFSTWWCGREKWALNRWPRQEKHLTALHVYLNDEYLDDRHFPYLKTRLPPILPCDLAKK